MIGHGFKVSSRHEHEGVLFQLLIPLMHFFCRHHNYYFLSLSSLVLQSHHTYMIIVTFFRLALGHILQLSEIAAVASFVASLTHRTVIHLP